MPEQFFFLKFFNIKDNILSFFHFIYNILLLNDVKMKGDKNNERFLPRRKTLSGTRK